MPNSQARYVGEEAGSVDGLEKNITDVGAVKAVGRLGVRDQTRDRKDPSQPPFPDPSEEYFRTNSIRRETKGPYLHASSECNNRSHPPLSIIVPVAEALQRNATRLDLKGSPFHGIQQCCCKSS